MKVQKNKLRNKIMKNKMKTMKVRPINKGINLKQKERKNMIKKINNNRIYHNN